MDIFFNFLRSDIFLTIMFFIIIILAILYITTVINLRKLRTSYQKFMNKLGNGNNLDEMMKEYMKKVNLVEEKNNEIISYCKVLDDNMKKCTQKIGIVRYNAFKDTGSDLSFSLAILDDYERKPNENPSIGLILCRDVDKAYAEYVIRNFEKPMGVATFKAADDLPEKLKKYLPDPDDLKKLL